LRGIVLAVLAMIAILAVILIFPTTLVGDRSQHPAEGTSSNARIAAVARNVDLVELPAPDVPLAQAFEPLRRAARNGNNVAACRLGMEMLRCRSYERDLAELQQIRRRSEELARKGEPNPVGPRLVYLQS